MKRLILIRHAKSDWSHPRLADHGRPLNTRGKRSATTIGNWLREKGYDPEQAISSSSKRTQETWSGLGFECPIEFTKALYHADQDQMLTVLKHATKDCVLMLGHNPGIADFADSILSDRPKHDRFFAYPTCATLIADFDITSWSQASFGKATEQNFIVPRDLA